MTPARLAFNTKHTFAFATDGPGILTLAWTEPPGPTKFNKSITDPQDNRIWIEGPQHRSELQRLDPNHINLTSKPALRTLTLPLTKPGRYTLAIRSLHQTTNTHLGYAWTPLPDLPADRASLVVLSAKSQAHTPLQPGQVTHRDPDHWITAFPRIPIGHLDHGANPSGRPKTYYHPADGPGLLTVTLLSEDATDMALSFESHALKPKLKLSIDEDLARHPGFEIAAAYVHSPDNLAVRVVPLGGGASYRFAGSWLSLQGVAEPSPPRDAADHEDQEADKPAVETDG